ncbi:sigma-70 family RNA polymerase sigma factor [Gemmata sp. JC717]|uniref:sigma-70 family RNA polymerase sigma factor n=1 Tax=Gemmata algarum TaxID=2975278 RepID=UPI0021BA8A54|nr:sigma-70 family RNA polymerase sigma factor [Gemmata algarum]MDY3550971.1 sigma-70 family RNA polymerase sigma factor [Gemmata algarum]
MATRGGRAAPAVLMAARRATETDRELLDRFTAGDDAAFAALVARHTGMVLGVGRRVLPTVQDAEDACQATFLILAQKARAVKWQASVANWLYGTARRIAARANRAAHRRVRREARPAPPDVPSALDQMTGREAFAALDAELDRLPPIYREPLVLCHLEGLTRDEAAARLGVPPATLKSRLDRGRKRLADALGKKGIGLGAGLLAVAATSPAGASPPRLTESVLAAVRGAPPDAVAALVREGAVTSWKLKGLLAVAVAAAGFGLVLAAGTNPDPQKQADKTGKPATTADAPVAKADERTVRGTVLGTDGKPVAGAKLFRPALKGPRLTSPSDVVLKEVARTDAAGKFRATLTDKAPSEYLIAHAPGAGIDWAENPAEEVTLRLVPDVPIRGRVITTEGKPAPGVSVTAVAVYVPRDENLDDYLTGWKASLREAMSSQRKRVHSPLTAITGAATTDADGRFALSGLGGERIVHLVVEGGGTARQNPMVITRTGFDPKPYNDVLLRKEHQDLRELNYFRGLNGPAPTLVAERGKTIEGTVLDAATGKPVAGAAVSIPTGFGDALAAVTGADGKYKLVGVAKRPKGYGVHVQIPDGGGYLSSSGGAADTDGFAPVALDIKLARGVVVTGRVIDKQTGKGVRAGVRLAPLPGNAFFGKGPGSDAYRSDKTMRETDKDGKFRLTTIPGQSLLMVQAFGDETFNGAHLNPYRAAEPDPAHKELFRYDPDDDTWMVTAADGSLEFLRTEQAVRVVDLKETGETDIEVTVDRGRTGRIEVQDADGKPLTGVFVAGVTASWPIIYRKLPESTATIYALNPDKPRTIAVYHPAENLGAVATIRGDEKEPVVVKLAPAGTVTGRFTEADGGPLVGAEITANAQKRVIAELYRFTVKERPRTVTDAKGQFTLPAIVPGMEFHLQIRKGEQYFGGKPKLGPITLKPGETKALGDRTLEVLR